MNRMTAVGEARTNPARFTNASWEIVRVSDLNNDGKPDILWQDPRSGELCVWYMNGTTMTSSSSLTPSRPSGFGWSVAPR